MESVLGVAGKFRQVLLAPASSHEQAEHAGIWPWRSVDARLCVGSTVSASLQVRGELGTLSRDLAVSESCVFPDLWSSQRDVCT